MVMPQRIPLLTLTFVCTWCKESPSPPPGAVGRYFYCFFFSSYDYDYYYSTKLLKLGFTYRVCFSDMAMRMQNLGNSSWDPRGTNRLE